MELLYNQGSVEFPEDGIIFKPPFHYGVSDGVSGLYLPEEGPRLFEGRTGGQLASHALSRAVATAHLWQPLPDILKNADNMLRKVSKSARLNFDHSEILPAAAFAIASVEEVVKVLIGGDSLAVWRKKDGTIGGSPNQMYRYEMRLREIIAGLMEKHLPLSENISQARQKMWRDFVPILTKERRAHANKVGGYSVINGQKQFDRLLQSFTFERHKLELLILFTDGFVPIEWTRDGTRMANTIFGIYKSGGLHSVLESSRKIAKRREAEAHETLPEAAAIAIDKF